MSKGVLGGLALLVCLAGMTSGQKASSKAVTAYRALEREYAAALAAFQKAYRAAKTDEERQKAYRDKHPRPADFAPRYMALAQKYADSPVAVDALSWVVLHPVEPTSSASKLRGKALSLLESEHIQDERLGRLCTQLVQTIDAPSESFLRTVLEKSKNKGVQARACATLAQNLKYRGRLIPRLKTDEEARKGYEEAWGKPVVRALLKKDASALLARSEELFERVADKYGKVKHPIHGTLAGLAKMNLLSLRRPITIGKVAPNSQGTDLAGKSLRLNDYRGKVILLDFWAHSFPSCRAGYPIERALVKRLAGKPFVILGVNADNDREAVKETMAAEKLPWRSLFDGGYTGGPLATRWDVEGWPTLFLIDHKGVVRHRFVGWGEQEAIEKAIDQLVRQAGKE